MTATTEPRGGLDLGWSSGEDGWGDAMNANLLRLSRLGFHPSVLSATTTAPPGSPVSGCGYIIPSGATGAWVGRAGQVAVWDGSAWAYAVPRDGWTIHVVGTGLVTYEDGAWSQANIATAEGIGAEPYAGTPVQTSFWRSTAAGVRAWVQLVAADITDLATTLAGYLTKANPTYTGTLTGPTAAFTNLTATGSPVFGATSGGSRGITINSQSGTASGVNLSDGGVTRASLQLYGGAAWRVVARDTDGVEIDSPFYVDLVAGGKLTLGGTSRTTNFRGAIEIGAVTIADANRNITGTTVKGLNAAGIGIRPAVALADGTFDDQDAAVFLGTIGAAPSSHTHPYLPIANPTYTGRLTGPTQYLEANEQILLAIRRPGGQSGRIHGISFMAQDSASAWVEFGRVMTYISSVTAGAHTGGMRLMAYKEGAILQALEAGPDGVTFAGLLSGPRATLTEFGTLAEMPGNSNYATLHATGVTRTGTNYALRLADDGTNTLVNASSDVALAIAGTAKVAVTASEMNLASGVALKMAATTVIDASRNGSLKSLTVDENIFLPNSIVWKSGSTNYFSMYATSIEFGIRDLNDAGSVIAWPLVVKRGVGGEVQIGYSGGLRPVRIGGALKNDNLAGSGTRPLVALSDGTIDDQDAATFRGTIGAAPSSHTHPYLPINNPAFTGRLSGNDVKIGAPSTDGWVQLVTNNTGSGTFNVDFLGGVSSNRRMTFRWSDTLDNLNIMTSNDDGSARLDRVLIPRSSALPIAVAGGFNVSSGNLSVGGVAVVDSSRNITGTTVKGSNLTGAGDRPVAADLTGTLQPKTPEQFRNMIFALASSLKGAANGVAELGADGKVPSAQLPSAALLALGETSSTAYRGDRGKIAYDHAQLTTGNPHGTTAADVGAAKAPSKVDVSASTTIGSIDATAIKVTTTDVALTLSGGVNGQGWDIINPTASTGIKIPSGATLWKSIGSDVGPTTIALGGGRPIRITRIDANTWIMLGSQ